MEHFDHHSERFAQHWRDVYAKLRAECPVAQSDAHGGFHVLTRYDDVRLALRKSDSFACGRDLQFDAGRTGGVTIPINPVRMGMMEMDPPLSQKYRRILAARFSAKAADRYRPRMTQIVTWLIDRVVEHGRLDVVDDLANPLPALVSLDYFGLPLERWQFYATVLHQAAYRQKGSARVINELLDDLRNTIRLRRTALTHEEVEEPTILDLLLQAEVDGDKLDDDLVAELMFMLLNGGIDTSTALIASMLFYLGENHEQRKRLAADPNMIPAAVAEMLRYFTPGTGVARTVVQRVELSGVQMVPGDRVLLALGSANNDEEIFDRPDDVMLDRDNSGKHLTFGSGGHRCLGAFLAPMEMTVLLEQVLGRMSDYEIDLESVRRYPTIPLVNGFSAMPATFTRGKRVLTDGDQGMPKGEFAKIV